MLSRVLSRLARTNDALLKEMRRNIGISAVMAQKAAAATGSDPIQQLFLTKIREYDQKSKAAGGKLVDADATVEKNLADNLEKIARQYSATGPDFLKFPTFAFTDPEIKMASSSVEAKAVEQIEVAAEETEESREEDKTYMDL